MEARIAVSPEIGKEYRFLITDGVRVEPFSDLDLYVVKTAPFRGTGNPLLAVRTNIASLETSRMQNAFGASTDVDTYRGETFVVEITNALELPKGVLWLEAEKRAGISLGIRFQHPLPSVLAAMKSGELGVLVRVMIGDIAHAAEIMDYVAPTFDLPVQRDVTEFRIPVSVKGVAICSKDGTRIYAAWMGQSVPSGASH